jgi:pimeloyl-ACP methyl ester carboxylesterase
MAQAVMETVDQSQTLRLRKDMHEVLTGDGMRLCMVRKRPVQPPKGTPVLMLHGLGQNRYSWDLSQRSLANYFVAHGHEVFVPELRGHGLSRASGSGYPEHFEDYVDHDGPALIRAACEISGHEQVFLVGHSLGATISYCMSPAQQRHIRGIVPIAGPSHFGRGVRLVSLLARSLGQVQRLPLAGKMVPRAVMIDWIGMLAQGAIDVLDHPRNTLFDYLWYPRSIRRDILTERIASGFDRTGSAVLGILVKWARTGRFLSSRNERDYEAMLADIRVPALFVTGDMDAVVPRPSVEIGYECFGSADKNWREFGMEQDGLHFGHCDLVCGDAAPRTVWPCLLDWIHEHDH